MLMVIQVEFCLEEWRTGVLVKTTFDEKTISKSYKLHLKGVTEWQQGNPGVMDKIREKFFKRAM